MIYNLSADDSTASRCLSLIARYAPLAMRANGGALGDDRSYEGYNKTPDWLTEGLPAGRVARRKEYQRRYQAWKKGAK